jgi:hypothetical protein
MAPALLVPPAVPVQAVEVRPAAAVLAEPVRVALA